jgi:hypothetical protein
MTITTEPEAAGVRNDGVYAVSRIRASLMAFAVGKAISAPLSLLLILMLAAVMPRAEYASYVAATAMLEIGVVLGPLGIEWVLQTTIAGIRVNGNAAQLRRATLLLGALPFLTYGALSAAIFHLAAPISAMLGGVAPPELVRLYAIVLAIEGPTRVLRDGLMAALLLQQTAQISLVLRVALVFAMTGGMALVGEPIEAVDVAHAECVASLAALITVLIALAVHLHRARPRAEMTAAIGAWLGWRSAGFASHAYGSIVLMLLIGTDVMTALVARFLGAEATAAFGFVVRLIEIVRRYLPLDMFWGVLRPAAIGRHEAGGRAFAPLMRDCNHMIDANLLVIGVALALALAVGDAGVSLLSGGRVQTPLLLPALLLPLLITHTVRRVVELAAYTRGHSGAFVRAALVCLLAPALSALALAAGGSPHAAVAAVLVVDLLFTGLAVAGMRARGDRMHFNLSRWRALAMSCALGGGVGAVVALAMRPLVPPLVATGVALFLTLMSFALAVVGLRVVGADDRLWLNNVLRTRAAPST